jgi:hypothetical protein
MHGKEIATFRHKSNLIHIKNDLYRMIDGRLVKKVNDEYFYDVP